MKVTRHASQTLLYAACFSFVMFGLVTIFLVIYKMPILMIVASLLASCVGLLIWLSYGVYLIWRSLTRPYSQRLNEDTHLLSDNQDLEAGASYEVPLEVVIHKLARTTSSPLPAPRPGTTYRHPTPLPCRDYRLNDYMTRMRAWTQRHFKQSRRHTVSESAATDYAGRASTSTVKSTRTYTKSESAVHREGLDSNKIVQGQPSAEDIFEMESVCSEQQSLRNKDV